jgi:hypothetical protein
MTGPGLLVVVALMLACVPVWALISGRRKRPRTVNGRRSRTMATYGIVHRFQGGTREQYENVMKIVHPDGGKALPEGQMLHLAGKAKMAGS